MFHKLTLTILSSLTCGVHAATTLTEAASGDFSDDYLNPTQFNLMPGVNTLQFRTGGGVVQGGGATDGSDGDFVTFILQPGQIVTSMAVSEPDLIITPNGGAGPHFFGAQYGTTLDQQPVNDPAFGATLDIQRIYDDFINVNLLFKGAGVPDEQPDRTFAAFFQETSDTEYEITIEITVVPEPSTFAFFLLALAPLARRRR